MNKPVWTVILSNEHDGADWLNEERKFTDEQEALREAKAASQNPNTFVTVREPNGEEWSL